MIDKPGPTYRTEDAFGNVHTITIDGDRVVARNNAGVLTCLANYASSGTSIADRAERVRNAALRGLDALNAVCRERWEVVE